jgi:Na+/H+-dicarboxylate symporter
LVSNDYALFSGFGLGILFSLKFPSQSTTLSNKLLKFTYFILKKLFVPIMPLFILGFLLKLQHEQVLITICKDYFFVFLIITLAISCYLLFAYGALNGFQKKLWGKSLKNMTPAMMTGFSTMSSAAAMPFTIIATEQNVSRPEMARALIPSTVNIHMIGDSFSIIIFAMTILVSFGNEFLPIGQFLIFGFYYVIARFAGAGVPGGGVLIILPVLEQQLGFSPAMLSLITALYIIFDPIITSGNVMGNGAFAIAFSKLYQVIEKRFSFSLLQTQDPNKPKTAHNRS